MNPHLESYRNAFWYAHQKYNSRVELLLKPLAELPFWERRFDIVFLGAIIEHLADPISVIGSAAILAKSSARLPKSSTATT
jgi:2-polyprenyl-3-methyl-5-hydroxy-6-metoxy-1,4-benzoquinol methylase